VFCEESYNAFPHDLTLLVIVILIFNQLNIKEIKSMKTSLEKFIKKKSCGKTYNNSQCFVKKAIVLSPHDLNLL